MPFFLIIICIAAVVIVAVQASTSLSNDSLSRLALHFRGQLTPASLFRSPMVRFSHGLATVVLDYYSTGGEHKTTYTQVKVYGPLPRGRLVVYPEGFWSGVKKLFGTQDIEIGVPSFDEQYVIQGGTLEQVRAMLSDRVRADIAALRYMRGGNDIHISLMQGVLQIRKRSRIRDFSELKRLLEMSQHLYDMLTVTGSEGIEFVDQAEIEEAWSEGICQVCGEVTRDDVVLCSKCHTAHHRECWQYYGACSTYGCRETTYRYPHKRRS
jgi:hypothetical protein